MLILTRKLGECIQIGDEVKIQIIEIKGKQVRLGIEAPKDLPIHREEIYLKIMDENKQAVGGIDNLKQIQEELRNRKE